MNDALAYRHAPRTIICPHVQDSAAPTDLSAAASATGFFRINEAERKAQVQTTVRLAHDGCHLHITVVCDEPQPQRLVADCRENGPRVYLDDNVELFFDVLHDHCTYRRLAVNPRGKLFATLGVDDPWPIDAQVAVDVGERSWTIRMSIALKSFGVDPAALTTWGVNFGRSRRVGRVETSSWAAVGETFHVPQRFGDMLFNTSGWHLHELMHEPCVLGMPVLVQARFAAGMPRQVTCEHRIESPTGETVWQDRIPLHGPEAVVKTVVKPRQIGAYLSRYMLVDSTDGTHLFQASYPVEVSKPLRLSLPENNLAVYRESRTIPVEVNVTAELDETTQVLIDVTGEEGHQDHIVVPVESKHLHANVLTPIAGRYQLRAILREGDNVLDTDAVVFTKPGDDAMVILDGCEIDTAKGELVCLTESANDDDKARSGKGKLLIAAHIGTATLDQLASLPECSGVEIYNRAFASGDQTSKWDALLTSGRMVWGLAVDDTHILSRDAGNGWIMLRCEELSPAGVLQAMRRGSFYASNGPVIRDIQVRDGKVHVSCEHVATIRLIGRGGKVLHTAKSDEAEYRIRGDEGYVRVEVRVGDKQAWLQPIQVEGDRVDNPYPPQGPWRKGNTHAHTTMSDGEHHITEIWRWYRQHGYDFLAITDHRT